MSESRVGPIEGHAFVIVEPEGAACISNLKDIHLLSESPNMKAHIYRTFVIEPEGALAYISKDA
jgi:hypothetical protein